MRDVLLVVAIFGTLGMLFVLALAATKFGEAVEKERQASSTSDEAEPSIGPARAGWQREADTGSAYLAIALIVLAGMVIGQVVASALDVSGVKQILISSGSMFMLSWCLLGAVFLSKRSTSRE